METDLTLNTFVQLYGRFAAKAAKAAQIILLQWWEGGGGCHKEIMFPVLCFSGWFCVHGRVTMQRIGCWEVLIACCNPSCAGQLCLTLCGR